MMLPAELIDHIFSFLQKDIPSLKACSKALPLYSTLAERYIFAYIVIERRVPDVCNLILGNPRFLDYPRTLEIRFPNPLAISIMRMIPQMATLVSLKISHHQFDHKNEFFSTLRNCLQQSSFQELHLFHIYDLPFSFSVLNDVKCIKHLTLSNCLTIQDEASIPTSQLSLETLVLSGVFIPDLHRWAMRWVTRLTTLELSNLRLGQDSNWTAFSELLVVCSNSLTRLRIDMSDRYVHGKFPPSFTFTALKRLERLSVSALITENDWALPEIIRVVNTVPVVQDVILQFHSLFLHTSLARMDWSLLNSLKSDLTGKRPLIKLCVTAEGRPPEGIPPEGILGALKAHETIMDLVLKRNLVILKSEGTSVWGPGGLNISLSTIEEFVLATVCPS